MNRARAIQVMENYELDGLVATTTENFTYLSDYFEAYPPLTANPPRTNWQRRFFAILPRTPAAEVGVIVPRVNLLYAAQAQGPVQDIRSYGSYGYEQGSDTMLSEAERRVVAIRERSPEELDPFAVLLEMLEDRGLVGRVRLGVDEMMLSHNDWDELKRRLPDACLIDAYEIFREIRMIKTPEEVDRLRTCLELTNRAMRETIAVIAQDIPHRVAWEKLYASMFQGGLLPRVVCVGIGPSTIFCDTAPSDRLTRLGDLIKFDHAGIYRGYQSDTGRTGVVGQASDKQRRYYEAVRAGQQAGCAAVKPGVRAGELYDLMSETIRQQGIAHYYRPSLGHGIGREAYDPPLLGVGETTLLEPGMVINLECPYYELGFGGLQIEDTLLVTADGFEYLADFDRELFIVRP